MAKAIFTRKYNYSNQKTGISLRIHPSDEPQSFPQDVLIAAIGAGAAKLVGEPTAKMAEAGIKGGATPAKTTKEPVTSKTTAQPSATTTNNPAGTTNDPATSNPTPSK